MKLLCMVSVYNRQANLPVVNERPVRSVLSLGRKDGTLFLVHRVYTQPSTKFYKVLNNVEEIFSKFINQGKATIRLVKPPFDIKIQSKKEDLQSFLRILGRCVTNTPRSTDITANGGSGTSSRQEKAPRPPKIKLVVESLKDLEEPLPRSLAVLIANRVGLTTLRPTILRLQNLRILDLNNNKLSSLPKELSLLPNLTSLELNHNLFGLCNDWSWINSVRDSINFLSLSHNEMTYCPSAIGRLHSLKLLNLDHNRLRQIPSSLANLSQLQDLNLSHNELQYLPGGLLRLRLGFLDISRNQFLREYNFGYLVPLITGETKGVKSLVDIAASVVLQNRIPFTENDIPWTVMDRLENSSSCVCRKKTYPSTPNYMFLASQKATRASVTVGDCIHTPVWYSVRICSDKCRSTRAYPIATFPLVLTSDGMLERLFS